MPQFASSHYFTVATSAARIATTSFGPFVPTEWQKGVRIYGEITAIAASPSVVFGIEVYDPIGDVWHELLASAAKTGTGTFFMEIGPGVTSTANVGIGRHVGKGFRVTATAADADSMTYSLTGEWLA